MRKPVFWVSDQVRHKPGCTTTEDGKRLVILDLGRRGIALFMQRKQRDCSAVFVQIDFLMMPLIPIFLFYRCNCDARRDTRASKHLLPTRQMTLTLKIEVAIGTVDILNDTGSANLCILVVIFSFYETIFFALMC